MLFTITLHILQKCSVIAKSIRIPPHQGTQKFDILLRTFTSDISPMTNQTTPPFLQSVLSQASTYFTDINSKKLQSNAFEFNYLEAGKGETIIVLHGLAGSKSWWRTNVVELMKRYHVIALDVPGININIQLQNERATFHHLTQWFMAFIKEKKLSRFHLIGHSVSGALCAYIASKCPEYINSLTMISLPQWYSSDRMPNPTVWHLKEILEQADDAFDTYMDYIFYHQPPTPTLIKKVQSTMFNTQRARIDTILEDLKNSCLQLPARLLHIQCPCHLIYGREDPFLSTDLIKDIQHYIPNISISGINGCKHAPHIEKKSETLALIQNFLPTDLNTTNKIA